MEAGLRERKKERTRREIADAARRLFGERGFDRVTVAEVARAADVSPQTVFNYFPTKEDLFFWRLGAFEEDMLAAVRDRPAGESAVAAYRRFLVGQPGLLGRRDPQSREQLAALNRTIFESPSLRAREEQILAGYTRSLAALLAEEAGAPADDIGARVAATAMMGVHRALIDYTRRRVLEGKLGPRLPRDVRARADEAFALLETGLRDYAVRAG
jgi:AcrR family transcriptional regulator